MFELPKVGRSHRTHPNVFARYVMEDFSRLVGVPLEEAEFFIEALGAVIQERLLRGLPCGIPFVGTIYLRFLKQRRIHMSGISRTAPGGDHRDRTLKEVRMPMYPAVKFKLATQVRLLIRDSAPYTGTFEEHLQKALQKKLEINKVKRNLKIAAKRDPDRYRQERALRRKIKQGQQVDRRIKNGEEAKRKRNARGRHLRRGGSKGRQGRVATNKQS